MFQMVLTCARELLLYAQNDAPLETPEQLRKYQHETSAWARHGNLRERQHGANPHQSWLDWSLSV